MSMDGVATATASPPRLRVVQDGAEESPPAPAARTRRGGRPKGSKNRVSATARELLAKDGLAGIKALCSIAAGRAIFRVLKGGARERIVPELRDMLEAQRAILSRLVPELKATELTGADGSALFAGFQPDNVADLALLNGHAAAAKEFLKRAGINPDTDAGRAAVAAYEASVAVGINRGSNGHAEPVAHVGDSAPNAVPDKYRNTPDAEPPPPPPAAVGTRHVIGGGAGFIELAAIAPDGREKWALYDADAVYLGSKWSEADARHKMETLIAERRLPTPRDE
jgi:hypothetical protein